MSRASKNSITINLSLPTSYADRMREFAESKSWSLSEVVRHSFDMFELESKKERFGRYAGYESAESRISGDSKKAKQREMENFIRTGDLGEVSQQLIDWNYIEPDVVESGYHTRTRVVDNPTTGARTLEHLQSKTGETKLSYRNELYTIDELINDLKKKKKI